jgi:hypothetical protein
MIHVFFVPGMFGSTLEYVLRNYSNEYTNIDAEVLADGSMHSFLKEFHPTSQLNLDSKPKHIDKNSITLPIYPFNNLHLPEILKKYTEYINSDSREILIHAANTRDAELNMLFQYHKIAAGSHLQRGLDIFCSGNEHNIVNWNTDYKHWGEMRPWELREWISLFYVAWVQEWIESQNQVGGNFYKVSNTEILENLSQTVREMFQHCDLTESAGLDDFAVHWRSKQQYIMDEFDLLDRVVECTINNVPFSWNPVNIIAEAIVQQRLRTNGYEIRCDGLDDFPTDSRTLYNLLEKC